MIRYDKKLNQEINKTIRNFNRKIARLEKQGREILPDKVSKKELTDDVYSRGELKRRLRDLKRFSRRGAEEVITTEGGITTTKYQYDLVKKQVAQAKRYTTIEIKRLESESPKVFGVSQKFTYAQMGSNEYLNQLARYKALNKDYKVLTTEEFKRLQKLALKTIRNKEYQNYIFKENYFEMIDKLVWKFNIPKEQVDNLKLKMMKLKPKDFYELYKNDRSLQSIIDYYPSVSGKKNKGLILNPDDISEDVTGLFNQLNNDIDTILENYKAKK